jgi:hypothetical protein
MPYLSRGSLADRLRPGPRPWDEAVHVMIRLAGAVESAHRRGVLHRDIKPDNVLLSDFGEPQLTDFGIARMSGEWATTDGQVAGSLPYTAPELLTGAPPSIRSDVYGLGATLHHLLAGRPPFTTDTDSSIWQVYHRISQDPVPPLPNVPPDLAATVAAAMAKDPEGRPPSADAFGHALRAVQRANGLAVTEMAVMTTDEDPAGTRALDLDRPLTMTGPFGATAAAPPATATTTGPAPAGPRRTRWLAIAGIAVVLLLAAATVALTRDRGPAAGSPEAIGLATPGDGVPDAPATTAAVAQPNGEKDVTPNGKPVPLGDAGQSASAQIPANGSARLRFAGTPGRRALATVKMNRNPAQQMIVNIDRADGTVLAHTTFWGVDTTVGPARMEAGTGYSMLVSSPVAADVTMTVHLAPVDAVQATRVGAAPVKVHLDPFQVGVVTFAGDAGQEVRGHWTGEISETNDLYVLNAEHQQLADWSGSDDDRSDVVTLPAAGLYSIEVVADEGEPRDGQVAVERA